MFVHSTLHHATNMKKFLLLISTILTIMVSANASPEFESGKKYRIECKAHEGGAVVLGQQHGKSFQIYYDTSTSYDNDAWWYADVVSDGVYTLRNAQSGQYLTHDEDLYDNNTGKYLLLTDNNEGSISQWTFENANENGYYYVKCIGANNNAYFNLRTTNLLLGCYEKETANNGLFAFYDEEGNRIADDDTTSGGNTGGTGGNTGGTGSGGNTGGTGGNISGTLSQYINSIYLNGRHLTYDNKAQIYYYTLPTSVRQGGDFLVELQYEANSQYADHTLRIEDIAPDAVNNQLTLPSPTCSKQYTISLTDNNGQTVASAPLQFTYLPIVEIGISASNISYYYNNTTTFCVSEGDSINDPAVLSAKLKIRGATSSGKPKKSYAIKLFDENGASLDHKFFGLRSDNNWILDAAYIDPTCMRNRVATDLWNKFSVNPYYADLEPKARTGTRGQFVEVFMDGEYHGLYCMTEKIDRKQLKLKKFEPATETGGEGVVHGLLYKTKSWGYAVHMGHDSGNNNYPGTSPSSYTNNYTWQNYELKYPDYQEEAVDFEPIYNAVNFVCTATQTNFEKNLKNYFDLPTLRDYYLFIDLLLATDNHGKNMYYYVYDRQCAYGDKVGMAPWDLDGVFGINWAGSTSYTSDATQDLDSFLWNHEHGQLGIYDKLAKSTTLSWDNYLAARYGKLRAKHFNPDSLANRFATYAKLFADSQADVREQNKWSVHKNIQSAATYAENWVKQRVAALDEKYDYNTLLHQLPESASSTDSLTWYGITLPHTGEGWTANHSDILSAEVSTPTATGLLQNQQWALVGSINKGFKIKNRATGLYLVSNGNNITLGTDNADDASIFLPALSTDTDSETPVFAWRVSKGKYLNLSGGSLGTGTQPSTYASFALVPNSQYILDYARRFQNIPEGAAGLPHYLAEGAHLAQYKALYAQTVAQMTSTNLAQLEAMNLLVEQGGEPTLDEALPEGYYRLCTHVDNALSAASVNGNAQLAMSDVDERAINQIWHIETAHKQLQLTHANLPQFGTDSDSLTSNHLGFVANALSCGQFNFVNAQGNKLTNAQGDAEWYLMPVRSISIPLTAYEDYSTYATTYLPFDISNVEGAQAYVAEDPINGYMKLDSVSNFSRATGVLLISDEGNAQATLTLGVADSTQSYLMGTFVDTPLSDSLTTRYLVFNQSLTDTDSLAMGFFKLDSMQLTANTAYAISAENYDYLLLGEAPVVPEPSEPGTGGGETGGGETGGGTTEPENPDTPVVGVKDVNLTKGNDSLPYYDLSGRRVIHPVKGGVYIQGGKKVIK